MGRRAHVLIAVAALVQAAAVAHAQAPAPATEPAAPTEPAPRTAPAATPGDGPVELTPPEAQLFEQAAAAFDDDRFAEAAERFAEAYRLYRKPMYLFNLGQAHRQQKACGPALAAYEKYLAEAPADDPDRTRATRQRDEMRTCAGPPPPARPAPAPAHEPPAVLEGKLAAPAPPPGRGWMRPTGLALAGTGVALAAGAVFYGMQARRLKHELEGGIYDAGFAGREEEQTRTRHLAAGLAIGALAAGAAGTAFLFLAPRPAAGDGSAMALPLLGCAMRF